MDSGTNSTRLLVVDAQGNELSRQTLITRLGAGVDATGRLDPGALERTLEALAGFRDTWRAAGVSDRDVRIAATSAVRDASNRALYFDGVRDLTGVDAEVLSGDDEARLSFAGAVGAVDGSGPALLVDIGGGSTELVLGDPGGTVLAAHSMQIGAVRVTERHLVGDPPTDAEVAAARAMIDDALDAATPILAGQAPDIPLGVVPTVIGVAGTVTTLAAVHVDAHTPDDPGLHGVRLPTGEVASWADRLLAMPVEQRRALPAIPTGRLDVIAGGVLVLARVLARTAAAELVVSTADLLDGLVESMV